MKSIIRVAIARPRLMIAVWLVLIAICVPLALQLSGALKAGGFENPRGEDAAAEQTVQRAFDEAPESLQVVLHTPEGDVTAAVDDAARVVRDVPQVDSVADYRQNPQWLSPDRHTTFLQAGFLADATTIQNQLAGLRDRLTAAVGARGVEVNVTGTQALDYDLSVQSEEDAATAELIAFPLLIIVLLLVFRSVAAMLVPLVLAGAALVIAMAGGYLLTHVTDVSILYINAVSIIGLAVAVDYSLFIVKRYRDELAAGADYVPALQTAMRTSGHAVLFSGLAVVVALLAVLIPRIMVFTSMALAGIVVTSVAMAMSMTLLPAVLRLLGHRINWLSLRRRRPATAGGTPAFITRLLRRPVPLLLILVALFGLAALPTSDIRLQSPVASASILPEDADSRQGIERLQADLQARDLFPLQVVLTAPPNTGPERLLDSVRSVVQLAEAQPQTHSVRAVTTLGLPAEALRGAAGGGLGQLPPEAQAGIAELWTMDAGRQISRVVVVSAYGPDSNETHDLVYALRDKLGGVVAPGITAQVGGATAGGVDYDDALVDSLPAILAAVALITFGLLLWAFRSWRLPLLALVLNAMVVSASLGLLTLISQEVLGQPVDSTTPVLVFAVMFGLSMDYMVIMISRMREQFLVGGDHREAVAEGLRRTAGLVNGAALIMVAVFVSFISAKISVVQELGIALAIAVVLDAVVIRLLVMPAALYLLGRRVWGRTPPPPPEAPTGRTRSRATKVTVRLGALVGVLAVVAAPLAVNASPSPSNAFNLDTGNAALDVVAPTAGPAVHATVAPGDASIIFHLSAITTVAWYDSIAPYHPTAVGIYSRVERRPAGERVTNRQRNIAIFHASYQVLRIVLPRFDKQWRDMLTSVGLNPDDGSRDTTTPVGIGNAAAQAVLAARAHDGMNMLGDAGGRSYHRQPYADYTGYEPVNTVDELRDPGRWQPGAVTAGNGIFRTQKFVTPQFAMTKPFSYSSPTEFSLPAPHNSDPVGNPAGYREQVDEILRASASLTDKQKLTAEHFDDKIRHLYGSVAELSYTKKYTLDQFIFLELATNIAAFDAGITAWHFKRMYDAVRPFSAIRHLYGDKKITAWGGPGMRTVSDITGSEWRSYLRVADHPDYPSGSTTFCAAHAQVARRTTGTDTLDQSVTIAKGASLVEPGVTPREDTVIGWRTWTQWEQECAMSRVWGGVHFRAAVTNIRPVGQEIGNRAYEFVAAHFRGEARQHG